VAPILLDFKLAQLFLPPMSAQLAMRRKVKFMTNLKRKLLAVAMACFLSGGAFAQKRGEDKQRPPKDNPPKVVVQPKEKEKPPQNNNQGGKRDEGKKGRP
jgi:hypothetical protein